MLDENHTGVFSHKDARVMTQLTQKPNQSFLWQLEPVATSAYREILHPHTKL